MYSNRMKHNKMCNTPTKYSELVIYYEKLLVQQNWTFKSTGIDDNQLSVCVIFYSRYSIISK